VCMDRDLNSSEYRLLQSSVSFVDLVLERLYPAKDVRGRREELSKLVDLMVLDVNFVNRTIILQKTDNPARKISYILMCSGSSCIQNARKVVASWSESVVDQIRAGSRNLAFFTGAVITPESRRSIEGRVTSGHIRVMWHDVTKDAYSFNVVDLDNFLAYLSGNELASSICRVLKAEAKWLVCSFDLRLCRFTDGETLERKCKELATAETRAMKAEKEQQNAVRKQKAILQQNELLAEDASLDAETVQQGTSFVRGPGSSRGASLTLGGCAHTGEEKEKMFFEHFSTLSQDRRAEILKELASAECKWPSKRRRSGKLLRELAGLAPLSGAQVSKSERTKEAAKLREDEFRAAFAPLKLAIESTRLVMFGGFVPTTFRHTGHNLYIGPALCRLLMEHLKDLGLCYWFLADFVREFHSASKLSNREYPIISRLAAFATRMGPDFTGRYLCQLKLNTLGLFDVVTGKYVGVVEMLKLLGVNKPFIERFQKSAQDELAMQIPANLAERRVLSEMAALHWPLMALYAGRIIRSPDKSATLSNLDMRHDWFMFSTRCDAHSYIHRVLSLLYSIRNTPGGLRLLQARCVDLDERLAFCIEMVEADVAEVRSCPCAKDILSWLLDVARICHDLAPDLVKRRCSKDPGLDLDSQPMPRICPCVSEDGGKFVGALSDSILEGAGGDPVPGSSQGVDEPLLLNSLVDQEED